jgi:hypothetical protein
MSLKKGTSRAVIAANIVELIKAGHDPKQAEAAAYREAGVDACFSEDEIERIRSACDQVASDSRLLMAMDRSARTYDADGRLHVAVSHISKANVCGYYGREIPNSAALGLNPDQIYMLWRHPDELLAAAPTANNIPLLDTHIIVSPSDPVQESVVGSTGTDAAFNDPYLDNSVVIWTDWSIEGVEKREQCELSCAYRYVAVMQPGEHNGLHYDGIMRNIVFNHVALVPEGRAGPDVMVGDSLENAPMPLTSRAALMARGALAVALKPLMAVDAKVDYDRVLAGVNAKNFGTMKAAIGQRIATQTRGKLVSGASLDSITAALDAMEEEAEDEEPEDDEEKKKKAADKRAKDKRAKDRKAAADRVRARDAEGEETEEERREREAEDAAEDARRATDAEPDETEAEAEARYDKKAKDRKARDAANPPAKQPPGMDAKAVERIVKLAVDQAVSRTREAVLSDIGAMDQARRDVAPLIGEIAGDVKSARDLYVLALDSADVQLDGTESVSALRNMVRLLPTPDSAPARPSSAFALDAAGDGGYESRFPGANRVGHA